MTELQNDRMTDRTKTICPPIFDLGGIKILQAHECICIICEVVHVRVYGMYRFGISIVMKSALSFFATLGYFHCRFQIASTVHNEVYSMESKF